MRKSVIARSCALAAMFSSAVMADDLTFYSPYEILANYPGCDEPGMVTLHVKFETQASAHYFVNGLSIDADRADLCEIKTGKGTDRETLKVPCPEGGAPTVQTEDEQRQIDQVSSLPEVVEVKGEVFHCLFPKPRVLSRENQGTLSGVWSGEFPKSTGYGVVDGKFGRASDESQAAFYQSRTELLFDGKTFVTLPPYLRLFMGPSQLSNETIEVDDATVRLVVDLQLAPLLDVSCDMGGDKC